MQKLKKKLRIGWFSFTCCEDSTIIFTELLNEYFDQWNKIFDFVHFNTLKKKRSLKNLDIAFIEGAISGQAEEKKVKEIRENAKKVVAIGACACIGMPSSQRNTFDEDKKREIQFLLDRFSYLDRVKPLKQVIKIDAEVPGCPMNEEDFLQTIEALIEELT